MKKNEPISKVLTKDVITTHVAHKVSDVRKLFAEHGFHHVPVVSGDELVGLISASDILGISVEGVGSDEMSMDAYLDHQFSVEGLMKTNLKTLPEKSTIADAAEVLADGSIHAVPVVNGSNKLVGLVTSTDLIRYLHELF